MAGLATVIADAYQKYVNTTYRMDAKKGTQSFNSAITEFVSQNIMDFLENLDQCDDSGLEASLESFAEGTHLSPYDSSNHTGISSAEDGYFYFEEATTGGSYVTKIALDLMDTAFLSNVPGSSGAMSSSNPIPDYSNFYGSDPGAGLQAHIDAIDRCDNDQSLTSGGDLLDSDNLYFCMYLDITSSSIDKYYDDSYPIFIEFMFQFKDLMTNATIDCGTSTDSDSFKSAAGFGGVVYYSVYWTSRGQASGADTKTSKLFKHSKGMHYLVRTLD